MNKDQKNSQAYEDVLSDDEPKFPTDEEYMNSYRFWAQIANRDNDNY